MNIILERSKRTPKRERQEENQFLFHCVNSLEISIASLGSTLDAGEKWARLPLFSLRKMPISMFSLVRFEAGFPVLAHGFHAIPH